MDSESLLSGIKNTMETTISKIVFLIKNRTFLKYLFRNKNALSKAKTPEEYESIVTKYTFNYRFNYKEPRTFNEHLVWLKLYYRNDLWNKCADKLAAKRFLIEKGFGKYVPKTLKEYDSTSDICLQELPTDFVIKTNHDSGTVFICDKKNTDFSVIFNKIEESMKKQYSSLSNEWVYEKIIPKIFVEEKLVSNDGKDLVDYKFFLFNGKFGFGFVGQNRYKDVKFTVFDRNFNFINVDYIHLRPRKKNAPQKPKCWDEMLNIAEAVGTYFDFVRVDMYVTSQGPKIGELTFFSQSGHGPFTKKKYDFEFGKLFNNIKEIDFSSTK